MQAYQRMIKAAHLGQVLLVREDVVQLIVDRIGAASVASVARWLQGRCFPGVFRRGVCS